MVTAHVTGTVLARHSDVTFDVTHAAPRHKNIATPPAGAPMVLTSGGVRSCSPYAQRGRAGAFRTLRAPVRPARAKGTHHDTSATTRIQHFIRWQGFVVCVGFVV